MIIVEYCRFGNLKNVLVEHSGGFVDQIVRDEDKIDPKITKSHPRWSFKNGYLLTYCFLSFSRKFYT